MHADDDQHESAAMKFYRIVSNMAYLAEAFP
jgi:hypothetical protein